MPIVVTRFPVRRNDYYLSAPNGERVRILPCQMPVWIAVGEPGETEPTTEPFPAILDTGFNDDFLISEHHLMTWGMHRAVDFHPNWSYLFPRDHEPVPRRNAKLWLFPNLPGEDRITDRALHLDLNHGIAATPDQYRRLPILGVPALIANKLHLHASFEGAGCYFSLWTRDAGTQSLIGPPLTAP